MQRKIEKNIEMTVVATGVSSVVSQLVFIRECLARFQGNEYVIALILFNWLVLGGIGTIISERWAKRQSSSLKLLAVISLLLAFLSPAMIITVRMVSNMVFTPGVSVGFYPTLAFLTCTMAPYCLSLGFVLPYSLYVLRNTDQDYPGIKVYLLDNMGDVSGGAIFSFLLVFFLTPFQAVLLTSTTLILCVILISQGPAFQRTVILCAMLYMIPAGLMIYHEQDTLKPPASRVVEYIESRYGRILVAGDEDQYTLFQDGVPIFSNRNIMAAETIIHYPLSQVAAVKDVLLISYQAGVINELDKYHPDSIDYVEINPDLVSILKKYLFFPSAHNLNIITMDGRRYLNLSNKKYDAIILSVGEPDTYQTNRFYTDGFFRLAADNIRPGGVLGFSLPGYDSFLNSETRQKLSCVYNSAAQYFTDIMILPGEEVHFICANHPLEKDIPRLLGQAGITTDYLAYTYYGDVTAERMKQLREKLMPEEDINSDLDPHLMSIMFKQWFTRYQSTPSYFFAVSLLILAGWVIRSSREEFVIFSTGFVVMGVEILVIFAFQIYFGYIYLQIGLIITMFLAGLLPGGWFGHRLKEKARRILPITDFILAGLMLLFLLMLTRQPEVLPPFFFLIFGFIVSFLCGTQFPAALHLRGDHNQDAARAFSADLVGAAAGTLVTSLIMLPLFGFVITTLSFIALKLLSMSLVISRQR